MTTAEPITFTTQVRKPMTDTERIDRLERELDSLREEIQESKLWEADHDGRINEKWRNQDQTNAMVISSIRDLTLAIGSLSKKVWIGVGIVAVLAPVLSYLGAAYGGQS
jgi:hypothetical protein